MVANTAGAFRDGPPPLVECALETRHLSKSFFGKRALADVNLQVRRGEVHGLLGHNGSGKSTLIKILAGFHVPDPGSQVVVNGDDLVFGRPAESGRAGLRFVHQSLGLIPQLSVIENFALSLGYRRQGPFISKRATARDVSAALAVLDVAVDPSEIVADLRPIQRTVVAVARALYQIDHERGVLVLDEPTAALPAREVDELFEFVEGLRALRVATLLVSHRLDEVLQIVDQVSVLREGALVGSLPRAGLSKPDLVQFLTGEADEGAVDVAAGSTIKSGSPVFSVSGLTSGPLEHLDLSILPGEVVGVAGLDGSGREVIGRAIVGQISSHANEVVVRGCPLRRRSPRSMRKSGVVLAPGARLAGAVVPQLNVGENIALPNLRALTRFGLISRRREREVHDGVTAAMDIRPRDMRAPLRLLSGGNQQKVVLGKWLASTPTLLIAEEPTAGVDVGACREIYRLVHDAAEQGSSFLIVSSDSDDLVQLCSRVLIIRGGRTAMELTSPFTEADIIRALNQADEVSRAS